MGFEWKDTTVKDFCPFKYGKGLTERERVSGENLVVSSAGVIGTHSSALVNNKGIVIGRKGTVGNVTYVNKPFWAIDTAFYIEDEPKFRDLYFTYYLLKTLGLNGMNSDSAVPGLNRENAHSIKIKVPDLQTQRLIGSLLKLFDNRIDLLKENNQTLESIAQAIFKSWFIDFDPVHAKQQGIECAGIDKTTADLFPNSFVESELGLIPKGWEVKSLDEIATYLNGLALQKFPPKNNEWLPVIKIAQLRKGDTDGADKAGAYIKSEYIIKDGDVLFSWSGTLEVEIWCGGLGALNQHLFKVSSKNYSKWFYYYWTKYYLEAFRQIAAGKATTMGHIQRAHLKEAKVLIPPDNLLDAMNHIFSPLVSKIISNAVEAKTLGLTRDTLLPRLISGKLDLSNIEEGLEGVA
jgi:type I restriction enzyme S subunit